MLDIPESNKSIPSDQRSRRNSILDVPFANDNNNADVVDDELPVELLEKFKRLTLQDGRVCAPLEEPKVVLILHANNILRIFFTN